ncbi:MAG: 4Fe-4S dicluster domain-containing protein [Dethiobacter sp.]|jgi:Na+-translocating ferredoxin:NAD+ oxidoreductase RNF subunit RnfB|nr:4Fe-4S dicluster domain-containing protein [Dethiobacter sp.]MBS3898313.1 4Fe-4S dicluster domain-containing protein [Dethiobacter sp.]MBS3982346.1 4Fe-4S dicluster domain-containing protein [Dethiobacter sp.]MCL4462293.1 4Fe-4S dicluster domain-containing protein [Bacillota bacterium]MCL5992960.1 4Fe-4S dicluster domain-containing protein [Bacillota bacterium]
MGHLGIQKEEVYKALAKRLNKNPVGAPLNETLMQILSIMYTEQEAAIGAAFPAGFTTLDKLSQTTGLPAAELLCQLEQMADKGLVFDIPRHDTHYYQLSPLVIGFFEYTFMRASSKLPLKELAELFERYHREDGVVNEFFGADTKMFQTWAYESLLPTDLETETEVLTYEKASEMIRDAGGGSLTMCYCRHQAWHLGEACKAPIEDVCMSLGSASEWLVRRGFARPATTDQLLHVLEQTEELGLVHLADNVQKKPAYICHCCGCCCGLLRSINRHETPSVHASNFLPAISQAACTGCGACVERCHVNALQLTETAGETHAELLAERCLGCGACIRGCRQSAIKLQRKSKLYLPPKDKREQMANIAQEKGKLTKANL